MTEHATGHVGTISIAAGAVTLVDLLGLIRHLSIARYIGFYRHRGLIRFAETGTWRGGHSHALQQEHGSQQATQPFAVAFHDG